MIELVKLLAWLKQQKDEGAESVNFSALYLSDDETLGQAVERVAGDTVRSIAPADLLVLGMTREQVDALHGI